MDLGIALQSMLAAAKSFAAHAKEPAIAKALCARSRLQTLDQ